VSFLIHIVDDDAQVRAATSWLLSGHGYSTEVHSGGAEFLDSAKLGGGCVLLDLSMPGMSGHEVQEELARRGATLPVIVLSGQGDLAAAVKAMKLGASDFLEKPPLEEDLLAAIGRAEEASRRGRDRRHAQAAALARLGRLSRRERQILQGLLGGLSNKAIARTLGLSPRTVEMHRASMMSDLGVGTLPEAVRIAIDGGLEPFQDGVPPSDSEPVLAPPAEAESDPEPQAAPAPRGYEDRLRLLLEASTDGSWELDIESGELILSRRILETLGYGPGEGPDTLERLTDFIHPYDLEGFSTRLANHLAGRTETLTCEFRVREKGGTWRWLYDCGSVVERNPETGAPLRMVGSLSDLTRRKEEEDKAKEAAELLELAQWGAGAGVWDYHVESRQIRLCPRSRAMHGLPAQGPDRVSMEEWSTLVDPADVPAVVEALRHSVDTGSLYTAEFRTRAADGQPRWLLGLGKVIADEAGRPHRVIGLNQDVTHAKRASIEFTRVQKELIHVSRASAMGTMAATLAHELNQPLTAISNFSRGIRQRLDSAGALEDEGLREALQGAERSAKLAAEIVGRLRRQVESGEVERAPASLDSLIRDACSLALVDAEASGIKWSLDLDPRADPVSVDSIQMQQALLNLIRNAVDALGEVPAGRRTLRIATHRLAGGGVEIRVEDSGPGIPAEMRGRLFDAFTTSKPDGTGIGLSIARTIAESHGGHLRVEDREGGGAVFTLTIGA
jgi:PAS domain S-box-containing protein